MTLRKWGSVKVEAQETAAEKTARLEKKLESDPPHVELEELDEDDVTGVIDLVTQRVRTAHKTCVAEVRTVAHANIAASKGSIK